MNFRPVLHKVAKVTIGVATVVEGLGDLNAAMHHNLTADNMVGEKVAKVRSIEAIGGDENVENTKSVVDTGGKPPPTIEALQKLANNSSLAEVIAQMPGSWVAVDMGQQTQPDAPATGAKRQAPTGPKLG